MFVVGLLMARGIPNLNLDDNHKELHFNQTGGLKYSWDEATLTGVLRAWPMIVFSFGCQAQVISIFEDLPVPESKRTVGRFMTIVWAACSANTALVVFTGLFGVLAFPYQHLQGDVLKMLPPDSPEATISRACLSLSLVFMSPLLVWPIRIR
jgi:amino acid permease